MRALGIDPGLATTGLGLVDQSATRMLTAIDWCVIETKAGLAMPDRLAELAADLRSFISEHKPDVIVIEKLYFATNKRTAIDVAQARGVILFTAHSFGIPIIAPTPLQLKSAITGDGKADKKQMQDMMMRMLKLKERPQPDDAADGLALALYGLSHTTEVR